ncbi:Mss4-like protein [Ilyonectria robusta]|uniref:Mss4-like protein n=1 Tax=Ilyonectria robusta TaxID=1079257 RepID=UPI001E8EF0C8|nr:Mss4-like protein [Ilyonectria robusta]KAH8679400.1 Mss4-like protein [Ilyonectria robusta]
MQEGGCLCGDIRYSYTGEPVVNALCHCNDCRKLSGSTFSLNFLVPEGNFKLISGSPRTFTKTADSGNNITSYFCGNCGTTPFRDGDSFPNLKIIKAGTLDDSTILNDAKPNLEGYAPSRLKWIPAIPEASQQSPIS